MGAPPIISDIIRISLLRMISTVKMREQLHNRRRAGVGEGEELNADNPNESSP